MPPSNRGARADPRDVLPSASTRLVSHAGLLVLILAAFLGVRDAGWIQFDDPVYVTQNSHVVGGLTWEGITWFLDPRHSHGGNWHPLTSWSHMLDAEIFGASPRGPHLVNLALHALDASLLLGFLARATGAWWASLAVAALFALHPLRVESVAWISERKDVLSTLFFLLASMAWRRYTLRPTATRYLTVAGLCVLGLMSKPMLVTLPFVLLLLDVWPLGRAGLVDVLTFTRRARRIWLEKLPLFALSAISAAITIHVQGAAGATTTLQQIPFLVRLSNAAIGVVRYLARTFWPRDLCVYYPYDSGVPVLWPIGALVLIVATTILVIRAGRALPWLAVGWLWYLGTLVPVVGLVQVGGQSSADRYTYVTTIGVTIALVFTARHWVAGRPAAGKALMAIVGATALVLAWRTRAQVALWKDTRTLFAHALSVTRDNALAHQVYGNALLAGQDPRETEAAIAHLNEALRLVPDFPDAHNNLGSALGTEKRYEEAIVHFRAALRTQDTVEVRHNLGFALAELRRFEEAIVEYRAALALQPEHVGARAKLGVALGSLGRLEEARDELTRVLARAPNELESRRLLAVTLGLLGDHDGAVAQHEELCRRAPGDAERAALIEAHRARAVFLVGRGRIEDAITAWRAILALAPDDLDALNNVAWIRATHADPAHRDAREAVALAERARDQSPSPVAVLESTLAAAYAEAGRFEEAVRAAENAVRLARASGDAAAVAHFGEQLASYRASRPLRNR